MAKEKKTKKRGKMEEEPGGEKTEILHKCYKSVEWSVVTA